MITIVDYRAGNLALIANRADNSVSVLRIAGKKVSLIDSVDIGEQVAHVVFTPDGKRALAAKFPGHKVALLAVDGMPVGVQLMGQQHSDARITALARWLLETVPRVVVR